MDAGDMDKDGHLNYGEFVAISVHLKKMGNDDHLHKAFTFFDKNKNGYIYIEIEELRDALSNEVDTSSEEVITAIMQDVDTDKEFAAKIRQDIEIKFEAKMNRKMQENNAWVFKKLREANPELKFDIRDFCATVSSDQDDSDTPVTQGGATS